MSRGRHDLAPAWVPLSVTVAQERAEPLRRALFSNLHGGVKQIVMVHHAPSAGEGPQVSVHIRLAPGALGGARQIVTAMAESASPVGIPARC
jgi:hypothetical protein